MFPTALTLLVALCLQADDLGARMLGRVNAYRKDAGLNPVTLDADLSRACLGHAQYLVKNLKSFSPPNLNVHEEDPKLPGYSAAGHKAAQNSVIALGGDPLEAVDGWMGTLFHRLPILDPDLRKIGVGYARAKEGWFTLMDTASGKGTDQVVIFPVDGQKNVALEFVGPEYPNPIPREGEGKPAGFPITASFPQSVLVQNVTASLKDAGGKEVAAWLSSPEKPSVPGGYQRNTLCLIPKSPLQPNTTYRVTFTAKLNEKDWQRSWSFTTGQKQ